MLGPCIYTIELHPQFLNAFLSRVPMGPLGLPNEPIGLWKAEFKLPGRGQDVSEAYLYVSVTDTPRSLSEMVACKWQSQLTMFCSGMY